MPSLVVVHDDGGGGWRVVSVEQWADLRREHFVVGRSIKELARSTGMSRNTIRRALRSDRPPSYERASRPSVLEPFKPEIHRMLKDNHALTGVRVRELLEPLGCTASKTVVDDYLREVRPLFAPAPRTFQRTVYRPGEICQFDVWEPRDEIPVGHGETRRGWVVIACLRYSRAGAGVLVFRRKPEICWRGSPAVWSDWVACRRRWSGIARRASTATQGGRPMRSRGSAASCASAGISARRLTRRPRARSSGCRATRRPTSSPVASSPTSSTSRISSTAGSRGSTHARTRRSGARPIDRLATELEVMAPLPERMPDTARRWTMRVPPDPHLRLDTNDYSLDPALVGRRVEVICDQRTVTAVCLDTGEVACRHARTFARHRTITALEHARALRTGRQGVPAETPVEIRPLTRYDALIA